MQLMYKNFNLTVLKIDFTFHQDKDDCDVFIFGHKDFERVQAKWGIKSLHIWVATSYVYDGYFLMLIIQNNEKVGF